MTRLRLDTLVSRRTLSAIAIPDAHAACRNATSRTLSAFAIPSFGNELPLSLRYTAFRSLRSGHKHQRFKLGLKRSENGSLAQVPLPFFGSPYAVAFRSVYVTGERNRDAIAPRYSRISPSPIGNRYSVATLRSAPYESGHKHH